MKKQNEKILTIVISSLILGVLSQYFLPDYKITSNLIASLITVLSIFFGFYITSFTVFSTSRYISELYKIDDIENKNQTLMHTVLFKYKTGLVVTLVSIVYFVSFFFILEQFSGKISVHNKFTYPIVAVFMLNITYAYLMLNILVKIIKQESKRNGKK